MASTIKVFNLSLSTSEDEAFEVLKKDVIPLLEPSWNRDDVLCEKITSGYVNITLLCSLSGGVNREKAIVIRIYGDKGDVHESHDLEFVKMQIGHYAGCFGEVLASFENGCIYRYTPGRCLTSAELSDPGIIRKSASLLARFQYMDLSKMSLVDRKGQPFQMEIKREYYVDKLREYIQFTSDNLVNLIERDRERSKQFLQEYRQEVAYAEAYLAGLNLPCSNCHGSFHFNNIVYDEISEKVSFVDYEFSGWGNIAMYDFGYLFGIYRFGEFLPKLDLPSEPGTDEVKKQWLKIYLESKHEIDGGGERVTELELERWKTMLDMMSGLSWLSNAGRWHNIENHSLDVKMLSTICLQIYKEVKPHLPALRERYLKLTPQQQQQQQVQ